MAASSRPLRVFVITEDDPLYVIRFFDVFFAELPRDRVGLVGITVSRAFHEPIFKTARRIWRFYGTVDFVRLLARWTKARLSGRRIGTLARAAGVPVFETESVNAKAFLETLRQMEVDVVVSVAAPEVFRAPLLAVPKLGAINIHSGRLPQYRGMMPTFWQMLAGEPCATVTIHEMAEKLDAGGIIATLDFPIEAHDALDRVITGTKEAGARLMIETLLRFDPVSGGRPTGTPIDIAAGKYNRFPDSKSVREFRARGHRML
jgi:methionyl-tRNA formyltransferase